MTTSTSNTIADVRRIPLEALHFSETPAQVERRKRYNANALNELAETLKSEGQLQPILVRPILWNNEPREEVVFGERRVRAAKINGWSDILAIVRELDDHQAAKVRLIENLQREDEHPLAEAEGYDELVKQHGYTVEQIADETGKSKAYVYARLKLLALGSDARKAFYDEKLSASTALLIARIPIEALQKKALTEITRPRFDGEGMSYREAAEYVQREYMLRLSEAPFPTGEDQLCKNVGPCGPCPKRTGNQPELFADVSTKDTCTDPSCFKAKVAAWSQRQIEKAEAAGQKVITGKAAKAVFTYGEQINHTHVKLADKCWEDPKQRTYRQLLGKDAKPDLVQVPESGKLVEVLPRAKAMEQLRKAGVIKREKSTPATRSGGSAKAANAKAQREQEIDEELERRLFKAIHTRAPKALPRAVLEQLADEQIGMMDYSREDLLLDTWGWSGVPNLKELRKLTEPELHQLLYELHALHTNAPSNAIELAAKALKIDVKKIREEVKASLTPPAPTQPAKKKAAKK